jgi:transcriptional regulator with XRE-family HTH domain
MDRLVLRVGRDMSGEQVERPPLSPWEQQRAGMGALIRHQRELANMSLRQLSQATQVSNAYLSQLERGMHDPTVRVLLQIGDALHLSLEEMLDKTKAVEVAEASVLQVEEAIAADSILTDEEKRVLLIVYRSYVSSHAERDLAAYRPGVVRPMAAGARPAIPT